ncbi:TPA: signal peptidase I, partial [Streptococcus agalactiae]
MKRQISSDKLSQELDRVTYQKRFWSVIKNTIYILMAVASIAILIAVLWLPVLRIYGHSM